LADLGGVDAVGGVELAEDVRDVDAHRLLADEELVGDLAVGSSEGELGEDLDLARGEPEVVGDRLSRRVGGRVAGGGERDARALRETLDTRLHRRRADLDGCSPCCLRGIRGAPTAAPVGKCRFSLPPPAVGGVVRLGRFIP
jgi:hypothetical protein